MSGAAVDGAARLPTVVLVVGVHRSGTSLLTSMLGALGCGLGDVDPRANEENPRGFFEERGVRATNERILKSLGGRWDNFGVLPDPAALAGADFATQRREAVARLAAYLDPARPLVLKDPRFATLLPFWLAAFAEAGVAVRCVLVVRHPDEVAASQVARAGRRRDVHRSLREAEPTAALWAVSMVNALRDLGSTPTLMVAHDTLYRDTGDVMRALSDFLAMPPQNGEGLVDHALRRAVPADGRGAWGDLAATFYERLAPARTPRVLAPGEASELAASQTALAELLPFLPAVGAALAASDDATERAERRSRGLRRAFHVLVRAAVDGGAGAFLGARRERLERALEDVRDADLVKLALAQAAEGDGRHEAALTIYEALVAGPDADAESHRRLVLLLAKLGRSDDAAAARQRAHTNFPKHPAFQPGAPSPSQAATPIAKPHPERCP